MRRAARRLDRALAGETLTVADLRVPAAATVDLVGARVLGTHVHGKHLLTRLDRDGDELTLHHHLRMDGRWIFAAAAARPAAGPWHQIRVWLSSASTQAVGLRLMEVSLVPTAAESDLIGHLGPDILANDWDAPEAARRIAAQGSRGFVETLLDQTVLAGLGTMWAAECAFTARVHPDTPADQVVDLVPALQRTRQRMRRAILDSKQAGRASLNVFERAGQPCFRCGQPLRSSRVGRPPRDRITYWCADCQPPPV